MPRGLTCAALQRANGCPGRPRRVRASQCAHVGVHACVDGWSGGAAEAAAHHRRGGVVRWGGMALNGVWMKCIGFIGLAALSSRQRQRSAVEGATSPHHRWDCAAWKKGHRGPRCMYDRCMGHVASLADISRSAAAAGRTALASCWPWGGEWQATPCSAICPAHI